MLEYVTHMTLGILLFKTNDRKKAMSISHTQQKLGEQKKLGDLLNVSEDVKIYTCEDFEGNTEVTVGQYMYLFYASKLKDSSAVLSEPPIDVFDMEIEKPTPGSENYILLSITDDCSVEDKLKQLLCVIE